MMETKTETKVNLDASVAGYIFTAALLVLVANWINHDVPTWLINMAWLVAIVSGAFLAVVLVIMVIWLIVNRNHF